MKILRFLTILAPMLALAAAAPVGQSAVADTAEVKRGWLGVYTDDLSKPMLVALDIDRGVLVTEVADESPAAKAGLESGDVITFLDGEPTSDGSALRWAVRDRPNKTVVVRLRRRGKEKKMQVTLAAREVSEQIYSFQWPELPREALRATAQVLREAGPKLKMELERSDLTLDSLREEMLQLKRELGELRQKLTEKQKSE
ncbi:MAG: PDZ domain-containing protein [Phycisphaerae bacterium]|nr:PDZ domain-containing protein [Phycisphaerae bacterium]